MKPLPSIFIALLLAASGPAAPAQETNPAARLDYNAFKIIAEKNIFDPTRRGRRIPGPNVRQRVVEHLTFSGVGDDYGKTTAFFAGDGVPNVDFKTGDSVKGLKIAQINLDGVQLTDGTNTYVLDLDNRRSLSRTDGGPWSVVSEQFAANPARGLTRRSSSGETPTSDAVSAAPSGGASSDIIERLKKRKLD